MKKFSFICFCFFLLGGFVFAKEGERKNINEAQNSLQQAGDSSINSSNKKTLKEEIQQIFQIQRKPKTTIVDFCSGGKEISIRNNLAKKTKESSTKIFGLIDLASKIGYETKNLKFLAEELYVLSSQIAEVCSLSDFNKYREQTKTPINSLKKEIASLKQYVSALRQK